MALLKISCSIGPHTLTQSKARGGRSFSEGDSAGNLDDDNASTQSKMQNNNSSNRWIGNPTVLVLVGMLTRRKCKILGRDCPGKIFHTNFKGIR